MSEQTPEDVLNETFSHEENQTQEASTEAPEQTSATTEESADTDDQYPELSQKKFAIFAGIVVAAVLVTTVVFFGLAKTGDKNTTTAQGGAYSQVATTINAANAPATQNQNQQGFISGGQYVCPICGHTAIPQFDNNGAPHCPFCGNIMSINGGAATGSQVAFTCPGGVCPPGGCLQAAPVGLTKNCIPGLSSSSPGTTPVAALNCPTGTCPGGTTCPQATPVACPTGVCPVGLTKNCIPGLSSNAGSTTPAAFTCPTGNCPGAVR